MAGMRAFNRESLNACPCLPSTGYCKFTVGASGAVGTLYQGRGNSVKSIVRNSAGNYTVTMNPPSVFDLLYVNVVLHRAAVGDALIKPSLDIGSFAVGATGETTFIIFCSGDTAVNDTTQVAADPITGSEFHLTWTEPRIKLIP